jgi:hypothetical protein
MHVYLAGIEHGGDTALMLEVAGECDPHGWCGFAVPQVTRAELERFLWMAHRVDPNGTWAPESITEGDGALIYEDECGRCVWTVAGRVDGVPVYPVNGWTWEVFDREVFRLEQV